MNWLKSLLSRRAAAAPAPAVPTPSAGPAPAFADRWTTSDDGVRLYARDYAGANGEARLPVVCLHGLTRNSADFEVVAPFIAATGRRVLAFDVRGRGKSGWDPHPFNYQPLTYARDVALFLDRLGIAKAVFIGTSMGGLIMMTLTLSRPELIAAGVLNDVGPVLSPQGLARIAAYTGKAGGPPSTWAEAAAYAKTINEAAFPHYGDDEWRAFARRLFIEGPDGRPKLAYDPRISEAFKAAPAGTPLPDLTPLFVSLTTGRPSLLVRGGISDLLEDSAAKMMQTVAPHLIRVDVPDVGHAPMLTEPEARTALLTFLSEIP